MVFLFYMPGAYKIKVNKIRKYVWILSGTLCVGLAIVGIFLPVLPTTPFLLLAAFCYGRGSGRFYNWLVYRSRFGGYIRNYRSGHGITVRQKSMTLLLLWMTIGFTSAFAVPAWWLKILLGIVATGVTIHILKMKTWRPDSSMQADKTRLVEPVTEVL
jgi:uncharacterized membrane protein YbaN (DUF454 family)